MTGRELAECGPILSAGATRPDEIARLISNASQRIWRNEWARADLCALLVASCDEGVLRRLCSEEIGISHRSAKKWGKVALYFDDSTTERTRRPEYAFRTAVKNAREDGAL